MQKINLQPVRGFRDFLPQEAIKREYVLDKIREVFRLYGYDPIETPALEYLEVFAGQIGEGEKMFYKFKDKGNRWVALRYDQSVPTARFVAFYPEKLVFPFKRYQIQNVWRAEKPQKGRYREFLQCDADIFGVADPTADAEVIALSMDIYRNLGFKEIKTLINDRALYTGIPYPVITAIDKLTKIGESEVVKEIIGKGYTQEQALEYLEKVTTLKPNAAIATILSYLDSCGFPSSWYEFSPTLARSFSYSTGPIWEVTVPGFTAGSVLGGERYDKLVGSFSDNNIPATGFAVGFDRTIEAMEQFNLIPVKKTYTQVLVTIFSRELLINSVKLVTKLRQKKIATELYTDLTARLDKQLKYADKKGIPYVVIIGPEEEKMGKITVKDMVNKKQETMTLEEFITSLKH